MKKVFMIKVTLCDKNRNFNEILASIHKVVKERDGVEHFEFKEVEQ